MNTQQDLLELEIAFKAFAQAITGTVQAISPEAAPLLQSALTHQVNALQAEHPAAAHALRTILSASHQQDVAVALAVAQTGALPQ